MKLRDRLYRLAASIPIEGKHECRPRCDDGGPSIEPENKLDREICEKIYKLPGIGYYGPTKSSGTHLDQQRCDTPEEAIDLYKKYWLGGHGMACWREVNMNLCYWKEGWGTLMLPEPSRSIYDSRTLVQRMKDAGMAYCLWTVPSVSSVSWGWVAMFKRSVYPPSFQDLQHSIPAEGKEGVWVHRDEKQEVAIATAALMAYEGADQEFRDSLEFWSKQPLIEE